MSNRNKYSYLCKDSIVEVTSKISGYVGSWYEAKVLEPPQLPKSTFKRKRETLVEYTNLNKNRTRLLRERVDAVLVRPLPPRIVAHAKEEEEKEMLFEVGDEVDTYDRDGWWAGVLNGVVRRRMEDVKEEESYLVRFEDPEHEIEFRGHELRLHLDWCDGKWFVSRDGKSQELSVTSDGCVSLASIRSSFKETTTIDRPILATRSILATGVVEKPEGAFNKSSMEEQLFVGTRLTHEEKQGEVQNAKDVCRYTSTEEQPIAAVGTDLTDKEQGEVQNPESIHRNPSMEATSHMACRTELNSMERGHSHVVENGGMSPVTEGVNGGKCAGDGVVEVDQSLPFVKSSPIWQAVESLEVFRKFPQNPHFLPLMEEREGFREGLAIAKMVTFANTAENIIKLSINDPAKRFADCLETLRSLELHGFDTEAMENRLTKLISLRDAGQEMEKQKNEIENQISELTHANAQLAKDIREIMNKIRSYQEQLASAQLSKEEKDSKISILKTSLDLMNRAMRGARVGFDELNISW